MNTLIGNSSLLHDLAQSSHYLVPFLIDNNCYRFIIYVTSIVILPSYSLQALTLLGTEAHRLLLARSS
jgi:hypothetical protein